VLLDRGKHIYSVYFPLSSVASLLNMVEGSGGVEIATVGNEGLLGLSVSWGIDTLNPQEFVQCQVPGDALVMDAETFAAKLAAGGELSWLVHRYTQAFVTQIGQQVACNGLHSVEEPTDPNLDIVDLNKQLRKVRQLRSDLAEGRGVWADTEAGRAGRELTEARRRAARSSSMAENAGGWRERRYHRKEAAAWTDRMAEALGRWKVHGAPEAGRLDGLLAQGEEAVQELTTRRDHRVESLAELDARRNGASRMLGTFERDIDALRDRLDGIDRPFEAKGQAERSFLRARAGLDYNPDHGIRRDLGHGLGR